MKNFMKRHKILSACIVLFLLVNVLSALPVILFYFRKPPDNYLKNSEIINKLKNNEKPYFSFIIISDTSAGFFMNEAATLKIISKINREDRFHKVPIDFIANIGDITFRGRPSHYRNYIKLMRLLRFPVISIIGNHDDDYPLRNKENALFDKYCGKKDFSFMDRNSYFIALDNINGNISEEQFGWLDLELKKSQHFSNTFIFMHKPPFNPYQQSWYRIEACPWSYRFLKLCEKYKVNMVFSGHEYVQVEEEIGGVKYIVCGGGGTLLTAPYKDRSFLNYIVVKVNGDYVSYETREVFPPLWEYFSFYIWKDLIYLIKEIL